MLVRALAEHWRSFNKSGRFPRSCAHSQSQQMSPFEHLVNHVLERCGASGVNTRTLVRRTLGEMRIAQAGTE